MGKSYQQDVQMVHDAALPYLGEAARTELQAIIAALDNNTNGPIRIGAAATPDSKLYFQAQQTQSSDGAGLSVPPTRNTIPTLVASTVDFQTQATTGGTFDISWPASTVGLFRRVGFTFLSSGTVKALFSAEAASVGALANPGTLFVSGSIPIGWVDLQCTNVLGYFKTAGSSTNIIENSVSGTARIVRFGSGGGGGSGTGDANELLERMKIRLDDSPFTNLNDVIFSTSGETKTGSTTATFNIINSSYLFTAGSQQVTTIQLLDTDFLALGEDVMQVEFWAFWLATAVDPSAVYSVSRDGGVNFQTATMTRVGTDLFRGVQIFTAEPDATIQQYNVSNADSTSILNATTSQERAQKFTLTQATVLKKTISLYLNKVGAATGGKLTGQIIRDSAGSPSLLAADIVGESFPYDIAGLSTGNVQADLTFSTIALPAGSYWVVIKPDATYLTDTSVGYSAGVRELYVRADSSAPTAPASYKFNGTSWSIETGVALVYSILGRVLDLRLKTVSSTSAVELVGMGAFYDLELGVPTDFLAIERQFAVGNSNPTSFTLSRFLPDPDMLKVYVVETGQVFRFGAFALQGYSVVFPANTFNTAQDLHLIFDQTEGSTFDTSDRNAALMAANFLGSTDATVDRSSNGRGIFLRRPDGVLREVTVDNSDNVAVYSV